MSRRTLLPESELRRCAKVSVEIGATIRVSVSAEGIRTYNFDPPGNRTANADDDLDEQMGRYLGK